MESKVAAVLMAGKKGSYPAEYREEEDAMAMASSSSSASPAAVSAFLAPPLSLLRHVACLCAGYLGLDGGLKPSAPAPAPVSSSSSSAATAACQRDEFDAAASEDCTEVKGMLVVRSRGFTPPNKPRSAPIESKRGAVGGEHH